MKNRTKWATCAILPAALIAISAPLLWTAARAENPPVEQPPAVETKVYDVTDLIEPNTDTNITSARHGITSVEEEPRASYDNAAGEFANTGGGSSAKTCDDLIREIRDIIESTVAAESWRDSGGTVGSFHEFNGSLIIVQSPANQDEIKQLLTSLRAKHETPLQFEEQVIAVDQKTLTAINEMGKTLSAKQVTALLTDSKIKLLASPRAPMLSGHLTHIYQWSSRNFIQSFRHSADAPATDASAPQPSTQDMLEPVIGNIMSGTSIDAKATLAPDRSTITIHLRQSTAKPKLSPAHTIPGKAGEKGFTTESPEIEAHFQETILTIPEGSYAILGGNRLLPPGSDKDVPDADNPFILYLVSASIVAPPAKQ